MNLTNWRRLLSLVVVLLPAAVLFGAEKAPDWLVQPEPYKAEVNISKDGQELTLANGLARRTIRLGPNAATIGARSCSHRTMSRTRSGRT